jgi:hypothetical protein
VPLPEQTELNATAPCLEPPPMVRLEDYNGPLKKTVGIFAQKLERKSVRAPHYKPGAILCSLEVKDKFILFVMDSIDPVSFLDVGFNAGLAQAQDEDRAFGQGAAGYGKRFAAGFADQAASKFFTDFAYPAIFSPAASSVGSNVLQDMGFDVLREFWPEISHKFKLPFRDQPGPTNHEANPAERK